MKAITLWQPWATLIAIGAKKVETRSWGTRYRGQIAIHSAKRKVKPTEVSQLYEQGLQKEWAWFLPDAQEYPLGAIIATARLADCQRMTSELIRAQSEDERACGDWQEGRFAWLLEDICPCVPLQFKGAQGLWELPSDLVLEPMELEDAA